MMPSGVLAWDPTLIGAARQRTLVTVPDLVGPAGPRGRSVPAGTAGSLEAMDVTDETFQTDVLARSATVPVIVDLWAPWCGPCKTLGPMLERAVAATDGAVELAKVNVDDNPRIAQSFEVQSIPAVFAIGDGKVADQFIGALPEAQVAAFVQKLLPAPSEADTLVAAGDEASLRRALELEPGPRRRTEALARILIDRGEAAEALALLARVPETRGRPRAWRPRPAWSRAA